MPRRKKNTPDESVSAPLSALQPPSALSQVPPNSSVPQADRMGQDLRKARNAMGITPRQVEEILRIKEEYVLALENGHYALLPTTAIARGFLRTYAQFLGLQAQLPHLLQRFSDETQNLPKAPALHMPQALPEGKTPSLRLVWGGMAVLVLLIVLYNSFGSTPAPAPIAAPLTPPITPPPLTSSPTPPAPTPAPEPTPEPAAAVTPAPAPAATNSSGMAIRAVDDVWVQIQDKMGATIFSRLLRQGEEMPVPNGDGLTLNAGNGAGVVLVLNGKATKPLGARAEVVRGIALNPKAVEQRLKAPAKAAPATTPATTSATPLATIAAPENTGANTNASAADE